MYCLVCSLCGEGLPPLKMTVENIQISQPLGKLEKHLPYNENLLTILKHRRYLNIILYLREKNYTFLFSFLFFLSCLATLYFLQFFPFFSIPENFFIFLLTLFLSCITFTFSCRCEIYHSKHFTLTYCLSSSQIHADTSSVILLSRPFKNNIGGKNKKEKLFLLYYQDNKYCHYGFQLEQNGTSHL